MVPSTTMAAILAVDDTDLGDERECILALLRAGFAGADIDVGIEMAIHRARLLRLEANGAAEATMLAGDCVIAAAGVAIAVMVMLWAPAALAALPAADPPIWLDPELTWAIGVVLFGIAVLAWVLGSSRREGGE